MPKTVRIQHPTAETYDINRVEVIKHYPVNEVLRLCNITRKQLLYYESKRLIRDVGRDPENNYRYYTESHLKQILLIKELKHIGFSLEDIGAFMQNQDMTAIKQAVRKRMENAKEELDRCFLKYEQSTEKYMQVMEAVSVWEANMAEQTEFYESKAVRYELITFPAQQVVSISYEGSFSDQEKVYYEYLSKLYAIVEEYGLNILGSVLNIYYQHFSPQTGRFDDSHKKIEICMTVSDLRDDCPYCRHLKPFRGVSVTHLGKHEPDLRMTYHSLLDWANKKDLRVQGDSVEEWFISPALTGNDELWVTKIILPLAGQTV